MKPEQQRIEIAEACGWQWVTLRQQEGLCDDVRGYPPGKESVGLNEQYVPDYLSDLNAIDSAVLSILNAAPPQLNWNYANQLGIITESYNTGVYVSTALIHATAAQRAEALLKTLNLWKP